MTSTDTAQHVRPEIWHPLTGMPEGGRDWAVRGYALAPSGRAVWLVTELLPDGGMFGLCDLGYVHLPELEGFRGPLGLRIERDMYWRPRGTLPDYCDAAPRNSGISELENEG